jgi:phytol kinase
MPADLLETLLRMAAIAAAYLALFGGAELLRLRLHLDGEVTRPIVHVAAGLLALTLPMLFDEPWPVIALGVSFVALMLGSQRLGLLRSIHGVRRRTAGAHVYPLGIMLAFIVSGGAWPSYPIAVLALAFGDAAAGVVGRRLGRHTFELLGTVRTVEGSLTAFGVAGAVAAAVLLSGGVPGAAALLLAGVIGTTVLVVEALSPRGLDNLTIPVAVVALFALPILRWAGG